MNLIFATHNSNKAIEIQQLIRNDYYTVRTLKDIGCNEDIEETGKTLRKNASIKSHYVFDRYHVNCFADDTGLLVASLNGEPGVYSARYAGEQKNDNDNMDLLLERLSQQKDRSAKFVTVISLILEQQEYFFEGELIGTKKKKKRGSNGFGYDPLFIPDGCTKTLAEFTLEEKNRISHRAKAFQQLSVFLKAH